MIQHVWKRALALFVVTIFGLASSAIAQDSLSLGDGQIAGLGSDTVGVSLTNGSPVEGFILAIGYDTSLISVLEVSIAGTVTESVGAELVIPEIFDDQGGFTLGVVLDFQAPFGGQTIVAGAGLSDPAGVGTNLRLDKADI